MTLTVVVVQQTNAAQHAGAMVDMFRQRARIFRDKLGWDVTVINGMESDKYDALDPVYLICTEAHDYHPDTSQYQGDCAVCGYPWQNHGPRVTGSLRLLPTTGPTLLADTFADTLPDAAGLSAPSIWECTRFCAEDHDTAAALIAALGDVALRSGIESIVGNFDVAMLRIYRRIGIDVQILGRTKRYGGQVFLGSFPVTAEILRRVKSRMAAMARVAA